ncbi:lipid IV(A) 3-deoxy-D-manno-octulosonic acid transferase [Seminibacterium arietis]|uniref:3-deoxy-D-manno-octulosonic acid transferase n=1 Tax=Seminibacterium arietis TaxID=1173502 RepID=A0ABW3I9F8_9PAST
MWRFLYTVLMYLIQPFVLLFMLLRSIKSPNYRKRLPERYGIYHKLTALQPNGIIIHAASVGEVIAATSLIKKIQQNYPHLPITVTTVTPTGSERVKSAFGDSVFHVYLPYDLPYSIQKLIQFVQPKLCIVIETEIWPNLIHQLYLRQTPFIIANARLSARSSQRYALVKNIIQPILQEITLIAPQDKISEKRYLQLGYNSLKLKLTGNIKFDLVIKNKLLADINELKLSLGKRPIWIAASTHEGEEEIILQSHRSLLQQFPNLLLILVPRHPERFSFVENLAKNQKLNYVLRSQNITPQADTQILIGDTMGELMLLYGVSDVAFVGGSLVKHGGHNPLEPASFKLPIISGKHTFNFPEIFGKLCDVRGVIQIASDSETLARTVKIFLNSPSLRYQYGNASHKVLTENRGALQRLFNLLKPFLEK